LLVSDLINAPNSLKSIFQSPNNGSKSFAISSFNAPDTLNDLTLAVSSAIRFLDPLFGDIRNEKCFEFLGEALFERFCIESDFPWTRDPFWKIPTVISSSSLNDFNAVLLNNESVFGEE